MPWFKVDDSAHNHPKFRMAGNAALGLWTRCGSYAAKHTTEGIVSGSLARDYGTPAQAAKLVKAGLWHRVGHDCPRCPQPGAGDFVMHDYFEDGRNATRAQAEAAKEASAERQRRHRARRNGSDSAHESGPNATRNEAESDANRARNDPQFQDSAAGQEGLSQRCDSTDVTPYQANYQSSTPYGSTSVGKPERAREPSEPIPEWALPLVHQLHGSGLPGLRWNLAAADWFTLHALMKAKGVEAMADHAARSAQSSSKPVVSARYFINGWRDLPNQPPNGTAVPALRALPGGTDKNITNHAALIAQLAAEERREIR